jgi:endonuclease-3
MNAQKKKSERAREVVGRLKKQFPEARTALSFANPLQLLVSTILSAQCTDARVNMITPALFAKYRTAGDFASAGRKELEMEIHSTGFFRAKAKNIINACRAIVDQHNAVVPKTMGELIALPGVGRKTANCVLGGAYGIQSGIVVDTHVIRISGRLGLTKQTDPERIEHDLMEIIPKKDWYRFSNLLILHGRKTCQAQKPQCLDCVLGDICPSYKAFAKKAKSDPRLKLRLKH